MLSLMLHFCLFLLSNRRDEVKALIHMHLFDPKFNMYIKEVGNIVSELQEGHGFEPGAKAHRQAIGNAAASQPRLQIQQDAAH
jgi:hypothetical protein